MQGFLLVFRKLNLQFAHFSIRNGNHGNLVSKL